MKINCDNENKTNGNKENCFLSSQRFLLRKISDNNYYKDSQI